MVIKFQNKQPTFNGKKQFRIEILGLRIYITGQKYGWNFKIEIKILLSNSKSVKQRIFNDKDN